MDYTKTEEKVQDPTSELPAQVSQTKLKMVSAAKDFRVKQEALWMELDYMMDGNHFVVFNKATREVLTVPIQKSGKIQRTVNLIRSKERGVVNMINKNEPAFNIRPDVIPNAAPEEIAAARQQASVQQHLCLHVYRKQNLKQKFKRWVRYGLRYGVGIAQVSWCEKEDDVKVEIFSPYEILLDPDCKGEVQDSRFVLKSILTSRKYLESTGKYKNLSECVSENKMADSDFRERFLASKFAKTADEDSLILHELWEKVNETDTKEESMKCTSYIGEIIVREEEYDYDKYPFILLYPQEGLGETYTRPWFADIISLNKALDALYSFVEEYIGTMGVGRYLNKKGGKIVTASTGAHGQILEYTGERPEPMNTSPLPQEVFSQIANTERYMGEIGGIQSFDLGQIAKSNVSGVAISQLEAQQVQSVGEPTDNLEYSAGLLFAMVLEMIAANYTEPRVISGNTTTETKAYKVRGIGGVQGADLDEKRANVPSHEAFGETIIDDVPGVVVNIVTAGVFSELQTKAEAMELFKAGLIDKETVLDAYKIGNIRELIERMETEQKEAAAAKIATEGVQQDQALAQQGQLDGIKQQQQTLSDLTQHATAIGAA